MSQISPLLISGNVDELVSKLTVEEKCALLGGKNWWETVPVPRLGIPSFFMTDGPHGVRKAVKGVVGSLPATCFPTACALASTWDTDLMEELGKSLAIEARSQDVAILLGPGINIKRSPLCGRNFEYFSSDPKLSGRLAAAYVRGLQSLGIGASVKHFAVNNQESNRMGVSAEVDERTMREIYFPAFEEVVKESQPWTVMCSYNQINGVFASEDPWLLTKVLREQWGYDGVVVSDWGAVNNRAASIAAGLDLEMPSTGPHSMRILLDSLKLGKITEKQLDEGVANNLKMWYKYLTHPSSQLPKPELPVEAHHNLARKYVAESIVMLKNQDEILPLDANAKHKLAVIGYFAQEPRYQGAGSSRVVPTKMDKALDEIRAIARQSEVLYAAGFTGEGSDAESLLAEAVAAAKSSTTAVLFLGLPEIYESEGFDRQHIFLPPVQIAVLNAVAAVQPRTIVCLSNGSVVSVGEWADKASAILECWLGGQAMGGGIADVLFGISSPGGRLPETIPLRLEDTPSYLWFPGTETKVSYNEGVMVDYRYFETTKTPVAFEFGFGLGYTKFEFSGLQVDRTSMTDVDQVTVSLMVKNIGKRAGREVVQVYVGDDFSNQRKTLLDPPVNHRNPAKELRAFAKTKDLQPGESTHVSFKLGKRAFAHFDPASPDLWSVGFPGRFKIMVGASVKDIRLETSIAVRPSTRPTFTRHTPIRDYILLEDPEINASLKPAMPFDIKIAADALAGRKAHTGANYEESLMLVASFATMPLHKAMGWSRGAVNEQTLEKVIGLASRKVAVTHPKL